MTLRKRKFGKTGIEVSPLGFGCMRLPTLDGDNGKIDIPLAVKMLRTAIDAGVDYIDTAWPYHGNNFPQAGESEPLVGRALEDGYRDKVHIATKLPVWLIETRADMDRYLDEQLKRLKTDHVDIYLVHNLNSWSWPKMRDLGVVSFLEAAVKDGRIRHPGFSFHDNFALFSEIMDRYDWPVAQIQYNYLDTAYQAGDKGFELAAGRGAALVIMEPLRGGFLVNNVPETMKSMLKEIRPEWSLADWALRWIWSRPGAGTVLSGMSTMEQVEENLRIAASPVDFGETEREALAKVRAWFVERLKVNCTACGYCLPCPENVRIPDIFAYYNEYHMADTQAMHWRAGHMYKTAVPEENRADRCVACRICEKRCPQGIVISERMAEAAAIFSA